jgi:hypothetical protein
MSVSMLEWGVIGGLGTYLPLCCLEMVVPHRGCIRLTEPLVLEQSLRRYDSVLGCDERLDDKIFRSGVVRRQGLALDGRRRF